LTGCRGISEAEKAIKNAFTIPSYSKGIIAIE
jgi:hypothetical protein